MGEDVMWLPPQKHGDLAQPTTITSGPHPTVEDKIIIGVCIYFGKISNRVLWL